MSEEESLSAIRMRTEGVREWSSATLRCVKRIGKDRLEIHIEPTPVFRAFMQHTSVEVYLPLGGCFIATINASNDDVFYITITEHLDPRHCKDDLLRFGIQD